MPGECILGTGSANPTVGNRKMSEQPPPHIHQRTIIGLEIAHAGKALEVAKKLAEQTGQTIIVRDADGFEINTVHPTRH